LRRAPLLLPILGLAAIAHAGGWSNGFVWDDEDQIEHGQLIKDVDNLGRLFTTDVWANVDPGGSRAHAVANTYRPLQSTSFMVSWLLFDASPRGYHIENVLYHCLSIWLLFTLWCRLGRSPAEAAWAAALFTVLPVNVEPVAWIAGRADVLMTAGTLAALGCYLWARKREGAEAIPGLIAMGVLWLAALLMKESAIVLPGLLLAYEGLGAEDGPRWRQAAGRVATLAIPLVIYAALRMNALGGAKVGASAIEPGRLALEAAPIAGTYLQWAVLPTILTVVRSWEPPPWWMMAILTALGTFAAISTASLAIRGSGARPRLFALMWFAISISPAVLFTHLSGEMGERYVYLPAVGLCWWLGHESAAFMSWFTRIGKGRLAQALMMTIIGLLLFRTAIRVQEWEDDFILYLSAIEAEPESAEAHFRLATSMIRWGEVTASAKLMAKALQLDPSSARIANNLAVVLRRRKDPKGARQILLGALPHAPWDPRLHYNLGVMEADLGLLDEAIARFDRALALRPGYELARRMKVIVAGRKVDSKPTTKVDQPGEDVAR
jgi:hypothetical protein